MGCTSAVPTSGSPTDGILVSPFIIVKFLFIMMPAFGLYDILWQQRVWHRVRPESFLLGLGAYLSA